MPTESTARMHTVVAFVQSNTLKGYPLLAVKMPLICQPPKAASIPPVP